MSARCGCEAQTAMRPVPGQEQDSQARFWNSSTSFHTFSGHPCALLRKRFVSPRHSSRDYDISSQLASPKIRRSNETRSGGLCHCICDAIGRFGVCISSSIAAESKFPNSTTHCDTFRHEFASYSLFLSLQTVCRVGTVAFGLLR